MSVIKVDQIESLNGTDEVSIPTLEPRMARAWVTYNGNASTITDSYNVLSVTDNGVGRHTVSFIDEVPTGYSVAGSVRSTSQTVSIGSTNEYSTSVDISTSRNDATTDRDRVSAIIFGSQS